MNHNTEERLYRRMSSNYLINCRKSPFCPHCGASIGGDSCDWPRGIVTYWGEDSPVETECERCGKSFLIKEFVERSWSTAADTESFDDLWF